MKHLIYRLLAMGIAVFLLTPLASAENLYVIDKLQITFRTGPGNDRKILSLLNSGQKVDVLEPDGDWARVRLQNGKEGWVLLRYLTSEIPCRIKIKAANQTVDQLRKELDDTRKAKQQITNDMTKLTQDLKRSEQERKKALASFSKLKKEAARFLELKTRHEKTVTHLSDQTQKASELDLELKKTRKKQNVRWFLGGAGVLLIGFILGFSSKKQKRHSSLL